MGNGLGIKVSAEDLLKMGAAPAKNTPQWVGLMNEGAKKLKDLGIQIGADGTEYSQSVRAKADIGNGFHVKANTGFRKGQGHNKYVGVGAGYNKSFSDGGNFSFNAGTGFYDGKNTKSFNASAQYSRPLFKQKSSNEDKLRRLQYSKQEGS